MANVFDVAKCILDQRGEMDTWKLQKLVYYCQAWSLVWDEKPLFSELIEAWANGPVCRELYILHKGMFSVSAQSPIWDTADPGRLTEVEKETIDSVVNYYGNRPGHWLRALTHVEEPWIVARGDTPLMEPCENEITHAMMRLYYGAL